MALRRAVEGSLVGRLFPAGTARRLELLRAAWPLAVGADLGRRTEVLALEGRTLRVRVPDAGWRAVLHRMVPQILYRLRALAADAAPQRIGFQEGPVAAPPTPAAVRSSGVPAQVPEAVQRGAEAIADPEVRRLFVDAAGRYLSRVKERTCVKP